MGSFGGTITPTSVSGTITGAGLEVGQVVQGVGGVNFLPATGGTYSKAKYPDLYAAISIDSDFALNGLFHATKTLPSSQTWAGVSHNGIVYLAIVKNSTVGATSVDGTTWLTQTIPSGNWSSIAANPTTGVFVMAESGTSSRIVRSLDNGASWQTVTLPISGSWNICFSGTRFFLNSTNNLTSIDDGVTWIGYNSIAPMAAVGVAKIIGQANKVLALPSASTQTTVAAISIDNLSTWTAITLPINAYWSDATFFNGHFILIATVIGVGVNLYTTADFITWSSITLTSTATNNFLVNAGKKVFATALASSFVEYSKVTDDGINWSDVGGSSISFGQSPNGHVASNGTVMIQPVANCQFALLSTDGGVTWSERNIGVASYWTYAVANGTTLAIFGSDKCAVSVDSGVTWNISSLPSNFGLAGTWYNHSINSNGVICITAVTIVSGVAGYQVLSSPDFINWTAVNILDGYRFLDIASMGTQFMAIACNTSPGGAWVKIACVSNDGLTWTQVANPPFYPSSIAANGSMFVIASSAGDSITTSSDGGATWSATIFTSTSLGTCAISYDGTNFLLLSSTGTSFILLSSNATSWVSKSLGSTIAAASKTIKIGTKTAFETSTKKYLTFTDATYLTNTLTGNLSTCSGFVGNKQIIHNGINFIIGMGNLGLAKSVDLISWDLISGTENLTSNISKWAIARNGNTIVAIAYNTNICLRSIDNGVTWTTTHMPSASPWTYAAWTGLYFVAICGNSTLSAYSVDGVSWSSITLLTASSANDKLDGVVLNNTLYFASSTMVQSFSTTAWSSYSSGVVSSGYYQLTSNSKNNTIYSLSTNGTKLYISIDGGVTWCSQPALPATGAAIQYNDRVSTLCLLPLGSTGTIYTSTDDGLTWMARTLPVTTTWLGLATDGLMFTLVPSGATQIMYISADGITWTSTTMISSSTWGGVYGLKNIGSTLAFNSVSANTIDVFARNINIKTSFTLPILSGTPKYFIKALP